MPVKVRLAKWRNSLGLQLPSEVVARLGLTEGASLELEAFDDGRMIITRSRKRYTLEQLLTGMNPRCEHDLDGQGLLGSEQP